MSAEVFLDTNILIYATAKNDPRAEIATALLAKGGRISVQVLNEFAAIARPKLNWPWPNVAEALAAFGTLCPEPSPIGAVTNEAALEIAQRHEFCFYDSLITAAAIEAGCSILLSEIASFSLNELESFVRRDDATRKQLEEIASCTIPRGSLSSLGKRTVLVQKILSLVENERAHATIERLARPHPE
jgi:predicted nucleic acid-binding protein